MAAVTVGTTSDRLVADGLSETDCHTSDLRNMTAGEPGAGFLPAEGFP